MSEWISVKDRLPEIEDVGTISFAFVVALGHLKGTRKRAGLSDTRLAYYWPDGRWQTPEGKYFREVTHWLPLPPKPEL